MIVFLIIIFGLVMGSFLNAVIYRLYAKISFLKGHSFCPYCRHTLNIQDLVPVFSFIFLKGRCRYCRRKISWQYPLLEVGTALALLGIYCSFGLTEEFFIYSVFTVFLLIIFVYDWRYYLILDKVSLPAIMVAIIGSIFFLGTDIKLVLLGMAIGGGFFLLQFLISKGKWIGGGDIRLGFLMGAMLAYPNVLVALFIAYVLGSVVSLGLVFSGRKKWQSTIPFGTFLSVATYLSFIFADQVVGYYQKVLYL